MATPAVGARAQGVLTDRSGTITTGGTAQTLAVRNKDRNYLIVQNLSATADLWLNFGVAAAASQPSFLLSPGSILTFEGTFVPIGLVSVFSATTGHAFTAKEG